MVEEQNDTNPRWEITEVQNYREALQEGAERINNGYPVSSKLIKDLHAILMDDGIDYIFPLLLNIPQMFPIAFLLLATHINNVLLFFY